MFYQVTYLFINLFIIVVYAINVESISDNLVFRSLTFDSRLVSWQI